MKFLEIFKQAARECGQPAAEIEQGILIAKLTHAGVGPWLDREIPESQVAAALALHKKLCRQSMLHKLRDPAGHHAMAERTRREHTVRN